MPAARPIKSFRTPIAFLLVLGTSSLAADETPKVTVRPVKVTISKRTTYLTVPLRSDGWIDYAAVINDRCSKGATVENNAAVLYWRAAGPRRIAADTRGTFFRRLGMDVPPAGGDYLISLYEYLPRRNEHPETGTAEFAKWKEAIGEQLDAAKSRPWTVSEFPRLAGWLNANKAPLKLMGNCAKRPRFSIRWWSRRANPRGARTLFRNLRDCGPPWTFSVFAP